MRPKPPAGHVRLVLFDQKPKPFYLEIPLWIIREVCRHPPKYLRYLGWCVLGLDGSLRDGRGRLVDPDDELVDRGVYHYKLEAEQDILLHAVDLEVIKLHSEEQTQTTETRGGFRRELVKRDGEQCVWTGLPNCEAIHIIPWSKSDEWLRLIIQNRPQGDEQRLHTLKSVNDIRNGIMGATGQVHPHFDSRNAAVLKTPNPILAMNDVPDQHNRFLPDGTSYPSHSRYTLQWLFDNPAVLAFFGRNIDAAFVSHHKPKPSDLLLHYNYGAAAVKQWGRNHSVLNDRPGVPRPQATGTVVTSPTKHVGDRTSTISELENARAKGIQQQPAGYGGGTSSAAAADLEQPAWDEDDVMLFFWGNSAAAVARRAKKEQERKESINKWRGGVGA